MLVEDKDCASKMVKCRGLSFLPPGYVCDNGYVPMSSQLTSSRVRESTEPGRHQKYLLQSSLTSDILSIVPCFAAHVDPSLSTWQGIT